MQVEVVNIASKQVIVATTLRGELVDYSTIDIRGVSSESLVQVGYQVAAIGSGKVLLTMDAVVLVFIFDDGIPEGGLEGLEAGEAIVSFGAISQ